MRAAPLILIAATVLLAGCAEAPFVQRELTNTIDKPTNTITKSGEVGVCHGDATPWAEVEAEAADACGAYGYFARHAYTDRYQCRVSAPHLSMFTCYHPEMTDAAGVLINPSDEKAVAAWQKRTGKTKPKPRAALSADRQATPPATLPALPQTPAAAAAGAAAPPSAAAPNQPTAAIAAPPAALSPPAPVPPAPALRPLGPADIAGKPAFVPAPLLAEPPPAQPLYPSGGGYTLPPGSWGQHFEE